MAAGSALFLALALALPATAQPIDDATRNAARELAHRAGEAYKKGDYETAQDLYHRSYALVPAPTLSLREARALVKLGRLVEAAEAYVRTTRTSLESDSPKPFREAVQQAYDELGKLRPQIPQLKIVVKGKTKDDGQLAVKMDGKRVSPALIGVAGPADPGTHKLTAKTESGASASGTITLKAGETKSVELDLDHTNLKAPGSTATTPTTPKDSNPKPVTPPPGGDMNGTSKRGSMQRTLGFVGLGVGAAGLGAGIVTGLMATSRYKSAEDECPAHRCVDGSQGAKDLDAFRSLRTVSTIGYVVGGVGIAAGVTLLLTAPESKPAAEAHAALDTPRWTPYVGLGSAGVAGTF
jgi:hypothetical protein